MKAWNFFYPVEKQQWLGEDRKDEADGYTDKSWTVLYNSDLEEKSKRVIGRGKKRKGLVIGGLEIEQ